MKNLDSIKFTDGANVETAREILDGVKNDISYRENTILQNLAEVQKNDKVPEGYLIYSFYSVNGNGFEAGQTPSGYSITC